MKKDWTVCILLAILMGSFLWAENICAEKPEKAAVQKSVKSNRKEANTQTEEKSKAELEAELAAVKEELSGVCRELANVLKESEKRDAEYARLKISIAASLAQGSKKSYDKSGEEALKALMEVSDKGDELVTKSAKFCDYMEGLLNKKEITDVERVRAKFRMSQLRETAETFHALIKKPDNRVLFRKCRVLAVNDKLQVLILDVGSVYGMRNGLLLNGGEKSELKLQVVAVRPFISGAIVIKGNIEKVAPGMFVYTGQ